MKAKILLLVALLALPLLSGCAKVDPGEVGVRTNYIVGKINPKGFANEYILNVPMLHEVAIYSTLRTTRHLLETASRDNSVPPSEQVKREDMLVFNSIEGVRVWCDILIDYSLEPKHAPEFHRTIGKDYFPKVLQPATLNAARIVIATYPVTEIYQGEKREEIQLRILERLKRDEIQVKGITIYEVILKHLEFHPEFQKKIEEAINEERAYQVELQRSMVIDQQNKNIVAQALGQADAKREQAAGDKDAEKLRAEGRQEMLRVQAHYILEQAQALNGGHNVAAYEMARNISDKIQVWGVPTGGGGDQGGMGLLGMYGIMGGMPSSLNPGQPANSPKAVPGPPQSKKSDDINMQDASKGSIASWTEVPSPSTLAEKPPDPSKDISDARTSAP
jgi:regulator of protease activity HflC (stomatin/prohibitin superfamily)